MKKIDYDDFKITLKNAERWDILKKFYLHHNYKNCVKIFKKYENRISCQKCKIELVESKLTSALWIDLTNFNYYKHDSTVDSNL